VRISITEIVVRAFNPFKAFTVLRELLLVFCKDLAYLIYVEDGMLKSEIPVESQQLSKAILFFFVIQPLSRRSFLIFSVKKWLFD